ncbi:hypothetical protein CSC82_05500 [Rhodobacteraceae bacterium 4F10]|nr:hypothetical protein CSC82_05500 [Rhodobacteraceae bacterium 4F10]
MLSGQWLTFASGLYFWRIFQKRLKTLRFFLGHFCLGRAFAWRRRFSTLTMGAQNVRAAFPMIGIIPKPEVFRSKSDIVPQGRCQKGNALA